MAGSGLGLGGCSSQASQHRKALCAIAKELCDCLENEEHNAKDNRKGRRGAEKSLSPGFCFPIKTRCRKPAENEPFIFSSLIVCSKLCS